MSFKRDGDDWSQLNVLKKRRVADLLSNYIPEDEAAVMNNGRYTCLVCSYGPVFDTVDMLTVHRNGKRHLEGLKRFYGRKAQVKNEMVKRKQEDYVRTEENSTTGEACGSAPLLTLTRKRTHHALLRTAPYSSRHRTTSTKSVRRPPSGMPESRRDAGPSKGDVEAPVWSRGAPSPSADGAEGETWLCASASEASGRPPAPPAPPEQRRREAEHYLQLRSSGWIQDRTGHWLKDENVEFDSDEEEPPSLSL